MTMIQMWLHLMAGCRHPAVAANIFGGGRAGGGRRAHGLQQRLRQAHQLVVRDAGSCQRPHARVGK